MDHIHRLPPELKAMILSQLSTREIIQNARGIDSQFRALVDDPGNNVLLYKPISDRERRRLRREVAEVTSFPEGMDLLHAFRRFLARRGRWTRVAFQNWKNRILAERWTQERLSSRRVEWSEDTKNWYLSWIVFLLRVLLSLYSQIHHHGPHLWSDIPQFTDSAHFKQFLQAWDSLPPRWLLECAPTAHSNDSSPQATLQLLTQWFVQIAHGRLKWLKGREGPSYSFHPPRLAVTSASYIGSPAWDRLTAGHGLRPDRRHRLPAGKLLRILGVPEIPGFGPGKFDVEACYCIRMDRGYRRLESALRGEEASLKRQHQSWILEQMYVF